MTDILNNVYTLYNKIENLTKTILDTTSNTLKNTLLKQQRQLIDRLGQQLDILKNIIEL